MKARRGQRLLEDAQYHFLQGHTIKHRMLEALDDEIAPAGKARQIFAIVPASLASPPSPFSRLLELLRPSGDRLRFARDLNVAEPHSLGAADKDGPTKDWFSRCHDDRAYSIGAGFWQAYKDV